MKQAKGDLDQDDRGAELVSLLREAVEQGSTAAMEKLVELAIPIIYGKAWQILKNKQDAEDVTQEVITHLAESCDEIRKPESIRAWLRIVTVRIARRKSVTANRSARERVNDPELVNEVPDPSPSPLENLLRAEAKDQLERALAALPKRELQCIRLRLMGASGKEGASVLAPV